MFEMVQLLAGTNLFLLAFSVLTSSLYAVAVVNGFVRGSQSKRRSR
jgi:hypothetical protein